VSKVNDDEDKEKWRFSRARQGWRTAEEVVVHILTTAKRIIYALKFFFLFLVQVWRFWIKLELTLDFDLAKFWLKLIFLFRWRAKAFKGLRICRRKSIISWLESIHYLWLLYDNRETGAKFWHEIHAKKHTTPYSLLTSRCQFYSWHHLPRQYLFPSCRT